MTCADVFYVAPSQMDGNRTWPNIHQRIWVCEFSISECFTLVTAFSPLFLDFSVLLYSCVIIHIRSLKDVAISQSIETSSCVNENQFRWSNFLLSMGNASRARHCLCLVPSFPPVQNRPLAGHPQHCGYRTARCRYIVELNVMAGHFLNWMTSSAHTWCEYKGIFIASKHTQLNSPYNSQPLSKLLTSPLSIALVKNGFLCLDDHPSCTSCRNFSTQCCRSESR